MKIINAVDSKLVSVLLVSLLLGACNRQPTAEAATTSTTTVTERRVQEVPVVVCNTCGTVRSINAYTVEGEGSGVGAAIGAIVGGLAGNQVGGGSGRKIATVAGVVGGAVAGNKIEQNRNDESWYEIVVAMEDGSEQRLSVPDAAGISVGSAVTVRGNEIYLR